MSDKIPAWALKKAIDFGGDVDDGQNAIHPLARLLVATREAALREAASVCDEPIPNVMNCGDRDRILALIGKDPS